MKVVHPRRKGNDPPSYLMSQSAAYPLFIGKVSQGECHARLGLLVYHTFFYRQ